jgi:transposase-like protein
MIGMHKFRRDVDHKLRVLQHADNIGDVGKACRYFGVGRASFYRWRTAYRQHGLAGLENRKTAPKNPANRTAPEIVEKVLYLRKTYRLGPIRIVWYLARYHAITISDAGVYRILRRHGLCLSQIKSGHIGGAVRRELNDKECAQRGRRRAIPAHPYPRIGASASHYNN